MISPLGLDPLGGSKNSGVLGSMILRGWKDAKMNWGPDRVINDSLIGNLW